MQVDRGGLSKEEGVKRVEGWGGGWCQLKKKEERNSTRLYILLISADRHALGFISESTWNKTNFYKVQALHPNYLLFYGQSKILKGRFPFGFWLGTPVFGNFCVIGVCVCMCVCARVHTHAQMCMHVCTCMWCFNINIHTYGYFYV